MNDKKPIETGFPRRSYSKQQLALLYFPYTEGVSAVRHLFSWIKKNTDLFEQLKETGYYANQKVLTPAQVNLIFEHLGEPDE